MKPILRLLGILAVIAAAVAVAVSFFFDADSFRPLLESRASAALGREVKLGHLKLSVFSGRVKADDLSVSDDPAYSANPFLIAKSVRLRVDVPALLFSRHLTVTAIEVDQPTVTLLQNAEGKWNISSLGMKGSSVAPATTNGTESSNNNGLDLSAAQRIAIEDGTLSMGPRPYVLTKLKMEVLNFSLASAFPFSLSVDAFGGVFQVKGKAGPVITADVAATPLDAAFTVAGVDLTKIPTSLGGLVSLQGSLNWDGRVAHLKAHGNGEKLKLVAGSSTAAHSVELDCAINHDLATQTGVVSQVDVHIGKALVHATGSYNAQKPQIVLNMLVSGQDMPMSDLAAVMPSVDVVLPLGASFRGGRASVRLAVDGPVDQLRTNGVISAAGVSIPGFDLGSRMSTLEKLAGIRTGPATEIQQFSTSEQSGPQGISLGNIKAFVTGVGQISGAGTISPSRRLNFKMRANLNSPGAVVATFGRSSTAGVPFTIEGTTSSPIFKADVKGIVAQELDVNRVPEAAADLLRGLLGGKKKK